MSGNAENQPTLDDVLGAFGALRIGMQRLCYRGHHIVGSNIGSLTECPAGGPGHECGEMMREGWLVIAEPAMGDEPDLDVPDIFAALAALSGRDVHG